MDPQISMVIRSVNPYNNLVLKTFEEPTDRQVDEMVSRAHAAYQAWRRTSFAERSEYLFRVAKEMQARTQELASLATLEMGKRIRESVGELKLSVSIVEYYAANGEKFLQPQKIDAKYGDAEIHYEPLGPLLGVMPWNFPYYQVVRFAAPNLMAGNVVLVKHSSNVPQTAMAIEEVFRVASAGREGLYTNLLINSSRVGRIIEDSRVAGVSLTGSTEAGKAIAAKAGESLKKVVLELGGSDPFIVLEDANIEKAVSQAVWSRMLNVGQQCTAAKRFIVSDMVADQFLAGFTEALKKLRPGDPMDQQTTLPPLSSEGQAETLMHQIDVAVANGAKVLLGGKRIDRPGAFLEPTILTDVKPDSPACREEFFGPVALFFRAKDEAEAIRLANDTPFGLGGAVFTEDLERGRRVAAQVESGMVWVNHPTLSSPELPFGGVKNSGFGRELSFLGITEFVNKKLVRVTSVSDPF
ncbi:MAG TPA: NAD-dependent succinate-semialdehyde dehydrogenase [Nitrososphaerales archaeon]|nr:NAD-dependent succinate-semialdehyde dehydrogenase [Nitrososphaerales archaeon]